MRLIDRARERWSLRDAQGYYEGLASGAAVLLTYGADAKRERAFQPMVAAAQQAYATNGPVDAIINIRMALMSEARFKFRSLVDKSMHGTEQLRILEYPWPNGTSGELISRMVQDVDMAGNAFIVQADENTLVRLPPAEVTIISQVITSPSGVSYKEPIGYEWEPTLANPQGGQLSNVQHYSVDQMAHWSPYPDPVANFRGKSWIDALIPDIVADQSMTTYKTLYMDRGQPISVIKYPQNMRADTVDTVVARLQERYGGVANAWSPIVLGNGADPIVGAALKDLDFRSIQAGGVDRICAAAGVPPILLGLKNENSGETYQEASRRFADYTARPLWRSMCVALQKLIPDFPPKGVELWYDTTDIAALQAAETERAQVVQVTAASVLTFIQAGFERESVKQAVIANDLSLLVPDPNAPTPGVAERETITAALGAPITGPDATATARPAVAGVPPGGGQVPTKPQTAATKKPGPASFPTPATAGPASNGSSNG